MFGPVCAEQQISDPFIQLIQEIYIPKQMSFSYLTKSCNITFYYLHELLVDLILYDYSFRYVLLDLSVRVSLQNVSDW